MKMQVHLSRPTMLKTGVMQQSEAANDVNSPATQPLLLFVVVIQIMIR